MMNKIPLEIVALSSSVTQLQSYAVVLGEVGGLRRIPIVIGSYEAQSIAVALEQIKPARPLTHDLMTSVLASFQIDLQEVIIYKLSEGIFYALLICERDGDVIEIDSRTSDAIALAIRCGCPIYTYENILNEAAGFNEDQTDTPEESTESQAADSGSTPTPAPTGKTEQEAPKKAMPKSSLSHYTIAELEEMMQKALDNEDYDLAIQFRDELRARGAGS
jgi:bifunctional DNase/RNase